MKQKQARPYETMVEKQRIDYNGQTWHIDVKAFYKGEGRGGKGGELRVYAIYGDAMAPDLLTALREEAKMCDLDLRIIERLKVFPALED